MDINYDTLVEELRSRSPEEKLDLRLLLDRWLVEEHREEFLKNHRDSLREVEAGGMHFSNDLQKLKSELSGS